MHSQGVFLNEWCESGLESLKEQFCIANHTLEGVEILLASYSRNPFCGEAFVLFRKNGVLYEVNASHNSTDGIEGQWEPEDTLVEALRYRLENGRLGSAAGGINVFADELRFLLAELASEGYR